MIQKNFAPADDPLNGSLVWCQLLVELLRDLSQWLAPASLDGRGTVGKQFGYASMTLSANFKDLGKFPDGFPAKLL